MFLPQPLGVLKLMFQGYLNVSLKHPRALGGVLQKGDFSTNLQHEYIRCCDPSLGLTTKAKGLQGCGPILSLKIAFSCPRSAKECEGKNPHTPKWTPMLGVRVPVDSRMFREWLQGSKPNGSRSSLYYWKAIET